MAVPNRAGALKGSKHGLGTVRLSTVKEGYGPCRAQ